MVVGSGSGKKWVVRGGKVIRGQRREGGTVVSERRRKEGIGKVHGTREQGKEREHWREMGDCGRWILTRNSAWGGGRRTGRNGGREENGGERGGRGERERVCLKRKGRERSRMGRCDGGGGRGDGEGNRRHGDPEAAAAVITCNLNMIINAN